MVSVRKLYSSLLQNNCLFVAHLKNNYAKSTEIRHYISYVDRTRNFHLQKNEFIVGSAFHEMSYLITEDLVSLYF